jgi:hypothetical protein
MERPHRFFADWYIDGYFQNGSQYRDFNDEVVRKHLAQLANELGIRSASEDAYLVHLRLGDFFTNPSVARRHLIERLGSIPNCAHIMTNNEAMLDEPEIRILMAQRGAHLVTTSGFAALDVLRTLARYRRIDANDSTLTVWAHVLAGTQVNFRDPRLSELAEYLGRLGPNR